MTWWKKGLLWSVACVGLIIAVGIAFDDALPNDGVSTICGSISGVVLVVVWIVAFMTRSGPASETDTRDYGPEKTILSARACNYLKNPFCLACGTAYVTDKRLVWEPLPGNLPAMIFGVKGVSIARTDLKEAVRTTFGANKNVLSLRLASGMQYKLLVDDVEEWLKVLA